MYSTSIVALASSDHDVADSIAQPLFFNVMVILGIFQSHMYWLYEYIYIAKGDAFLLFRAIPVGYV